MPAISQRILAFLLLLIASPWVLADNELTPHIGIRLGGELESDAIDVTSLELRPAVGLTYNRKLRPQSWFWTSWSLQRTEFDAPGLLPGRDTIDLDIHYFHAGTSYRSKHDERTHGFVMVGLGLTWVDPRPGEFDAEAGGSIVVGGGMRVPVRPGMVFRFDARGYGTFTDTTLSGQCGGVACQIDFNGSGAFQIELSAGLAFDF